MSDETTNPPAEVPARTRVKADKAERKFKATLVRGANYAYNVSGDGTRILRFKAGVPVTISGVVKDYLEEHAVDGVTVTDGDDDASTEYRQKFKFEAI